MNILGIKILNYRNGYIKTEDEELTLIEDSKTTNQILSLLLWGLQNKKYLMEEITSKTQSNLSRLRG